MDILLLLHLLTVAANIVMLSFAGPIYFNKEQHVTTEMKVAALVFVSFLAVSPIISQVLLLVVFPWHKIKLFK